VPEAGLLKPKALDLPKRLEEADPAEIWPQAKRNDAQVVGCASENLPNSPDLGDFRHHPTSQGLTGSGTPAAGEARVVTESPQLIKLQWRRPRT
jgi:hypothetical protein